MMRSRSTLILAFLIISCVFETVNGATAVNDRLGASVNTPICISVLSNDAYTGPTPTITVTNSSAGGFAYTYYPPFFFANGTDIVIEAENNQLLNWRGQSSYWTGADGYAWEASDISGDSGSSIRIWPGSKKNADSNSGPAVRFDIAFAFTATTYNAYVRGAACSGNGCAGTSSDHSSLHYLVGNGGNTLKTSSNYINAFGTSLSWAKFGPQFDVQASEITWPPKPKQFYLAMRESGVYVDRIAISLNTNYVSSGTGPAANTPLFSCDPGQITYFPPQNYFGADNFTYTINDVAGPSTGRVDVYVGIAVPSVTPTPSRTPSVTPSVTPSRTPSITPSITPTPSVTPSSSSSPSRTPSPSVTPSVSPSSSVTPSPSRTPTPSVSPSRTPSASVSQSPGASPSPTSSVTPSISVSPSRTPSNSPTPSVTPSISTSPSASPSATSSVTPTTSMTPSVTPSNTPSPSSTPSVTPSISVSPSTTPSNTPSPSITPSTTPSPIPKDDKSSDSGSNLGIAVGLGVGLPLCAIGIGVGAFITIKRRKGDEDPEAGINVPLLPPVPEPSDEKLASFEQLLLEDGYRLVKSMTKYTQITEADKIASWLVFDFEFNGLTIDLIKSLISREVKMANHAGSLMRANSMASKMMKSLSGLIAKPFLKMMFLETIEQICKNPTEGGASFEVDPFKVPENETLEKNQQKLQQFTSKFLRKIFESADQAPLEFRQICNALQKRVAIKFPESSQTSVGGFLFLRVYCPAIVAPSGFGIITSAPNAQAQRGLTLIAKTLQNIANNVNFGNKEEFMTYLNPFISNNFSACQDYFDEMATISPNAQPANTEARNITPEKREKALKDLYRHTRTIYPKMKDKYTGKDFFDRFYQIAKEDIAQDEARKLQMQQQAQQGAQAQATQPTTSPAPVATEQNED